jgi:hypothetical protein
MAQESEFELFSDDCWFRVSVRRHSSGSLQLNTYKWTHEIVEGHGEVCDPFWELISRPTFTDTPERAKSLAAEELQNWSGRSSVREDWKEPLA